MKQEVQVEILKELMEQVDSGKNIDSGVQYRMPTSAYCCPDIAAKEWDIFFQNHPQFIGLSNDLPEPGSFLTIDDFGTPVLATRDNNGQFHAFLNACRHRGVRVSQEERGRKNIFTCPFHAWSYSNAGALVAIPDEDHFGPIDKTCNGLIELPAVERDGLLWVHPQPGGELDIDELLGTPLSEELASYHLGDLVHGGSKTITMNLNWKLANDTFGETYHFGKLHRNTLAKIYPGNNLHLKEFGRNHRFVTASPAMSQFRGMPESEWDIHVGAAFVLYYLFPNITLIVGNGTCTIVKMYPDPDNAGRSTSQIFAYYSQATIDAAEAAKAEGSLGEVSSDTVYDSEKRGVATLEGTMEVFTSTVENEDYLMGELQQKSAENGLLEHVIFGRNEPPLHHFHKTFREVLGLSPLEKIE
ncbi:MAG: phenylpropionate dioxygenase-like ring-hydroxylating dioxygenase large terminal subunit [Candidatus Azotimanducaceae bacterium]|jgi:phenylpropionate dioxygenase-like ring-hydroxylating dioxygenase large terminal subunit